MSPTSSSESARKWPRRAEGPVARNNHQHNQYRQWLVSRWNWLIMKVVCQLVCACAVIAKVYCDCSRLVSTEFAQYSLPPLALSLSGHYPNTHIIYLWGLKFELREDFSPRNELMLWFHAETSQRIILWIKISIIKDNNRVIRVSYFGFCLLQNNDSCNVDLSILPLSHLFRCYIYTTRGTRVGNWGVLENPLEGLRLFLFCRYGLGKN